MSNIKISNLRKGLMLARQFFSLVMGGLSYIVVDQVGHWLCPDPVFTQSCKEASKSMINAAIWAAPILGYSLSIITLFFVQRGRKHNRIRSAQIVLEDELEK